MPSCSPQLPGRTKCSMAYNSDTIRTVCDRCRWNASNARQPVEYAVLDELIIRPGLPGEPSWITNPQGVRGYLCQYCEADEQERYRRNTAPGGPPPPVSRNGWQNTCSCWRIRIDLTGLAARYCIHCRERATGSVKIDAASCAANLMCTARNAMGALSTADAVLKDRRHAEHRPIACRCGRDTVIPTRHPKVTHCLACGGVKVDPDGLPALRATPARAAAAPRPLYYLATNCLPLAARPRRLVPPIMGWVRTNNNRKR